MALRQKNAAETETLEKEKAALEGQLADLQKAQETEAHALAEAGSSFLSAGNVTNQMLMTFIEKVLVYSGGRVEIVYRFKNSFENSEGTATDLKEMQQS